MTYIDRFELEVDLADVPHVEEQWQSFPRGSGATNTFGGHEAGRGKVEIWGEAAQDAFFWWSARQNPRWRVMRIDLKQDLPVEAMDNEELRSAGISLMQDPRVRARVGVQEMDRSGDKGTTMVSVGSYQSAKSLAVYGRGDGWRVEARLRSDAARLVCATLLDSDSPESVALDTIERVQWDLCREVIWPTGGKPLDLRISRAGQKRTQYTPAERIRRGVKGIILLAEKHGLWDDLAEAIPEVYSALHARAEQEARWDQAVMLPDEEIRGLDMGRDLE